MNFEVSALSFSSIALRLIARSGISAKRGSGHLGRAERRVTSFFELAVAGGGDDDVAVRDLVDVMGA